jgi:hypothetical protein
MYVTGPTFLGDADDAVRFGAGELGGVGAGVGVVVAPGRDGATRGALSTAPALAAVIIAIATRASRRGPTDGTGVR